MNITSLDVLAPSVDPRFRQLTFFSDEQKSSIKDEIIHKMTSLTPTTQDTNRTSQVRQQSVLDILLGPEETTAKFSTCREELDAYFAEKQTSREANPLIWWNNNSARFKRLAKVAKSLLSIPAERIFSNAGLTVNKLQSCLNADTVDALIFLNKNCSVLCVDQR